MQEKDHIVNKEHTTSGRDNESTKPRTSASWNFIDSKPIEADFDCERLRKKLSSVKADLRIDLAAGDGVITYRIDKESEISKELELSEENLLAFVLKCIFVLSPPLRVEVSLREEQEFIIVEFRVPFIDLDIWPFFLIGDFSHEVKAEATSLSPEQADFKLKSLQKILRKVERYVSMKFDVKVVGQHMDENSEASND